MIHNQLRPPLGAMTRYEIVWNPNLPGTRRMQHRFNGQGVWRHGRVFTMRKANNYGETHNRCAQMPGGTGNHERFEQVTVRNLGGKTYDFLGTKQVFFPAIHDASIVSNHAIQIWDLDCFD